MQVLAHGRRFPDPGRLDVGVIKGAGARADIVAALEHIARQTLDVIAAGRMAA
jgi:pseudouridine-5'-phosphate glycosidase